MLRTLSLSVFVLSLLSVAQLQAQTTPADSLQVISPGDTVRYWTTNGGAGLNFSQVKLSNWAGGGESSVSVGSLLKLEAKYAKGPSLWENKLNVAFGLIRQGDDDGDKFRKTDDLLHLLSQYNHNLNTNFYITGMVDFRSQMAAGHEYIEENGETRRQLISEFLAPGFLLTSIGGSYKKPEWFSISLSPLTGKFTFVANDSLSDAGAFGVDPGDHFRPELGSSLVASFEHDVFKNVRFTSNLSLFSNYETFSHTDVNWEGILLLKVNRFINSTVSTQLIYDHDVLQKTQFRNVINVGLLYQWPYVK